MRKILGWVVAVTATVFAGGGLLIAFGPGVELTNQLLALAGLAAGVAAVAVAVLVALPGGSTAPSPAAAAGEPGPRRRMSENTAAIVQGALTLAAALAAPAVYYVGDLIWRDLPVPGWRTVVQEGYIDLDLVYRAIWLVFLLGGAVLCWLGVYEKRKERDAVRDWD